MNSLVSVVADTASLELVVGYDIELRSVLEVDSREFVVFGPGVPEISLLAEDEVRPLDFAPALRVCSEVPLFGRAIADFKSAIRRPEDTGFHCYRAAESLLHHFAEDKLK